VLGALCSALGIQQRLRDVSGEAVTLREVRVLAGRMAADAETLAHYRQPEAACAKVAARDLTPLQRAMLLLLRQKDVFQLRHGCRLELVKTHQSLRDCRSINRIDVELRSICFGDEITIL
jgi:hypothetical protein